MIDGYMLSSVAEIAFEPIKSYSSDAVNANGLVWKEGYHD